MASSSGTSSGCSQIPNSGSEEDLQNIMNQRKQKRKLSNRESARRSRMRKQQHLDDLMAQVNQLGKDNSQIITALNVTTQHCMAVEAENSVLRTQMLELSNRLQSLNEILHCINGNGHGIGNGDGLETSQYYVRPWNLMPVMASADMFQYC
ncbi:bZIP transcription factor 44-like [Typha angustifolia]|uniref:bZIP transcription factor 44-like n=1 Tax=Typha angustifolia TaxID=59011 RepID=UPI003C2E8722